MKKDVTRKLVDEHRLILRMLAVLERQADLTAGGSGPGYGFYLQAVDFIRNYLLVPYRSYRKLAILA